MKLKPGKYLKSKREKKENFLEIKESKEALILESIGNSNGLLRPAYISLLESELVIIWQDQFEKIK